MWLELDLSLAADQKVLKSWKRIEVNEDEDTNTQTPEKSQAGLQTFGVDETNKFRYHEDVEREVSVLKQKALDFLAEDLPEGITIEIANYIDDRSSEHIREEFSSEKKLYDERKKALRSQKSYGTSAGAGVAHGLGSNIVTENLFERGKKMKRTVIRSKQKSQRRLLFQPPSIHT